jgi:UDP-N-acetylmuramoyl-L-alanyl-D-glutamate--2,6-diaminopimelate ligase
MSKKLSGIIAGLETRRITGDTERLVRCVVTDSRKAEADSLFVCIGGSRADGHDFVDAAADRGATSVLCARPVKTRASVTQVVVADVRKALAHVSSRFYDDPSRRLRVVGVTGTNGKTTTVHLIRSIMEASGSPAGMMGTLGHRIKDSVKRDSFTTPESPEVQAYMREMLNSGLESCVMEVSSHALALSRVDHVDFDLVVFTNLTRDHLDFHNTWEDYKAAKMLLFGIGDSGRFLGENRRAVVNACDATGREIAARTRFPVSTYALGGAADFTGRILNLDEAGTDIDITGGGETVTLHTRLRGRMNAENALAAFAAAKVLGIGTGGIRAGIESLEGLRGRMEFIDGPGRQAVVDYAHTPDALERLLKDVRQICTGRLICVFGCGGDRDPGKRPQMAALAGRLADMVIVTSDNPRTEDPLTIIDDIKRGLPAGIHCEVIPDRAQAINRAVAVSSEGDIIVVAGKGHEDYQIVGENRIHFDDREVVGRAFGAIADAKA